MGTTKLSGLSNSKKSVRMMARFAVIAAGLGFIGQAAAQGFPTKPVEMTVLFGSTAQTISQVLADQMSKSMPQPVVPVSRTGGGWCYRLYPCQWHETRWLQHRVEFELN